MDVHVLSCLDYNPILNRIYKCLYIHTYNPLLSPNLDEDYIVRIALLQQMSVTLIPSYTLAHSLFVCFLLSFTEDCF